MRRSDLRLRGMGRELRSASKELPSEYEGIHLAVARCQESIQELSATLDAAYEANETLRDYWRNESLTDADIQQLLALNRQLRGIAPFLMSVADDVRPRLEGKLADPSDPMYDYEIEARLDFILREDDLEYHEDDDNILTTRYEFLKHRRADQYTDHAETLGPEGLRVEAHCWQFHDLYDHDYGDESPSLSFRDCLRIGTILIDVQVWQQYSFDAATSPSV